MNAVVVFTGVPNGQPGAARFDRPINQSKQALSNMLRMRGNQYTMGMQQQSCMPPHNFQGMQRQQFIR